MRQKRVATITMHAASWDLTRTIACSVIWLSTMVGVLSLGGCASGVGGNAARAGGAPNMFEHLSAPTPAIAPGTSPAPGSNEGPILLPRKSSVAPRPGISEANRPPRLPAIAENPRGTAPATGSRSGRRVQPRSHPRRGGIHDKWSPHLGYDRRPVVLPQIYPYVPGTPHPGYRPQPATLGGQIEIVPNSVILGPSRSRATYQVVPADPPAHREHNIDIVPTPSQPDYYELPPPPKESPTPE